MASPSKHSSFALLVQITVTRLHITCCEINAPQNCYEPICARLREVRIERSRRVNIKYIFWLKEAHAANWLYNYLYRKVHPNVV